jgi:hypothetical protein
MSFILCVLRICCVELAKHSPNVGFTFGEIFGEFPQIITFRYLILVVFLCY